jgi:tetratricopeptide (TPR) repeat protein
MSHSTRGTFIACALLLTAASHAFPSRSACAQSSATEGAITLSGIVRDRSGEPVTGASIFVELAGAPAPVRLQSDAQGHFAFSLDQPGSYTLHAEKPGVGNAVVNVGPLGPGDTKQCDLVLAPVSGSRTPSASTDSASATAEMEFSDEPNFTVAGVKDWSNAGLHGSDTRTRTSDTLTKQTLALKPTDTETKRNVATDRFYRSALDLRAKGDFAQAREQARKSLAVSETAEGHRLLGDLNERLGDPLAAVGEFERAARMDPSEQNYFDWGTELLLHKAAQPAAEVFTKGSKVHPESSRLVAGLGVALFAAGSYDQAALQLCAAADLQPADPAAYLFLGEIEKSSTITQPCSQQRFARFLRNQPDNARANYFYALSLWKTDRELQKKTGAREVERLLEKSVTLDPQFAEAYVQLGNVRVERGDFLSAIEAYKKAIAADPQLADAHYRLGLAYKRAGEATKAQQEFSAYQQAQKSEAANTEQRQRELKQFSIIFKNRTAGDATPKTDQPH